MTNHDDFTPKERAMKHVITLGLMTLQIGALAIKGGEMDDDHDGLCEAITKIQTMVSIDLDIPMKRVAELFKIVIGDIEAFSCLAPEIQDLITNMEMGNA